MKNGSACPSMNWKSLMDKDLLVYLKYAHKYCWEQYESSIARTVKDFWENEAHNVEHSILELEKDWVVGT